MNSAQQQPCKAHPNRSHSPEASGSECAIAPIAYVGNVRLRTSLEIIEAASKREEAGECFWCAAGDELRQEARNAG